MLVDNEKINDIETPLIYATQSGNTEIIKMMILYHYDEVDKNGWTPLMHASSEGSLENAKLLKDQVNKVNSDSEAATMIAC
jgi:ankyrin repeat protein